MRYLLSVIFAGLLAISHAEARGPYGSINVGNWKGGAFTSDSTGAFSHCAAVAPYNSGILFLVSVNSKYGWSLGFQRDSWRLIRGQAFPIDLTFDGQTPFHVQGVPLDTKLVSVQMPANSNLINQFRRAKVMTVFAEGKLFQFNLDHTAQLLPSLVNCVASVKKNGVSTAGEFAVTLKKPVAVTAEQPQNAPDIVSKKPMPKSGSGFVVSDQGHVVTNQHVVDGCVGDIQGNLSGEAPIKLRLVSADETNDLALLQSATPFKDVVKIREKPIRAGESIVAIGYPYHGLLTSDFTVTTGIVSSLSGLLNDTRYLQISAAVQPGNSGGPLIDSYGQIVGVVAAKINALKFAKATGDLPENINFAIKPGALRDFLDNSAVPYQTSDGKAELRTAEIVSNARAYTLLISCNAIEKSANAKVR
jgi:S1-C subfamily serine protease